MPAGPPVRVLGVFAKEPVPGRVKTRLAAATSPEWAARVAEAFLLDTLERVAGLDARRVIGFAPREATAFFESVSGGRFALAPQADGDLGERMAVFFEQQLTAGADHVVLLGSDSPTLPPAFVAQAFEELERADLVLGPATDGGYYLIGSGRRLPLVFRGLSWGGSRVLQATIEALADPTWRLALLPPWYDVDTPEDWQVLVGHVKAMRRAGGDPGVPHTERLLPEGQITPSC